MNNQKTVQSSNESEKSPPHRGRRRASGSKTTSVRSKPSSKSSSSCTKNTCLECIADEDGKDEATLLSCLLIIDPLLQFLTKATGKTLIPLESLLAIIPKTKKSPENINNTVVNQGVTSADTKSCSSSSAVTATTVSTQNANKRVNNDEDDLWNNLVQLDERGVLHLEGPWQKQQMDIFNYNYISDSTLSQTNDGQTPKNNQIMIGFPLPSTHFHSSKSSTTTTTASSSTSAAAAITNTKKGRTQKQYGNKLHGSTKAAARRRLAALKKSFKDDSKNKKQIRNSSTSIHPMDRQKEGNEGESIDMELEGNVVSVKDTEVTHLTRGVKPPIPNHQTYKGYSVKEQYQQRRDVASSGINQDGSNKSQDDSNSDTNTKGDQQHSRHDKDAREALDALDFFLGNETIDDTNLPNAKRRDISTSKMIISTSSTNKKCSNFNTFILPKQASYAGSNPERTLQNGYLHPNTRKLIPNELRDAMGLQLSLDGIEEQQSVSFSLSHNHISSTSPTQYTAGDKDENEKALTTQGRRKLYSHQAKAVESIMNGIHTLVCTGTGSGKSLCFLLPILADVMTTDIENCMSHNSNTGLNRNAHAIHDEIQQCHGNAALIMFPTKALAQDQLSKLQTLIKANPPLQKHIRPGIIDGDTSHADRSSISQSCNIILTNPDTLHAAICPSWKKTYRGLMERIRFVVIDELHSYEGAFGAHVALVLSRLVRLCCVARQTSCNTKLRNAEDQISCIECSGPAQILFVGCSATIDSPEEHFRLLVPIPRRQKVLILTADKDGSPCAAKHFFVWNPPLMDIDGSKLDQVVLTKKTSSNTDPKCKSQHIRNHRQKRKRSRFRQYNKDDLNLGSSKFQSDLQEDHTDPQHHGSNDGQSFYVRTHAADETARILAHAVEKRIRCIAFCKTRALAEWVYERCINSLKASNDDEPLSSQVEIYRGGYSASVRRKIESQLFRNELYGVVGTSALELGVDIGGIDLTLHCGYPGSISSLMQQAGRAGRGKRTGPSFSIMISFSSPSEQHLWKHPKSLLCRGIDSPPCIPLNTSIVQGHLLCAAAEFPLAGESTVQDLFCMREQQDHDNNRRTPSNDRNCFLADMDLFGFKDVYQDAVESLTDRGHLIVSNQFQQPTLISHPAIKSPSMSVSLRSIEPINYSIVDTDHPLQGGRTDSINESAIMDHIPYSRVFYHCYPGAIIMHRGRRYKIHSIHNPPTSSASTSASIASQFYRYDSSNLGAFAKPTTARYSTRALSINQITVVKQLEHVEIHEKIIFSKQVTANDDPPSDDKSNSNTKNGNIPDSTANDSNEEEGVKMPSGDSDDGNFKFTEKKVLKENSIEESEDVDKCINTMKFCPPLSYGCVAGNGVVNVKKTVHGYTKLSLINRSELARVEISVPPMEYDTNALWIDCEASVLRELITGFDDGVHALSHALVAVAPLFVPCSIHCDIDCDHSRYECTRVLIFDQRAGGAGTTTQLWRHLFRPSPNGILDAAIELLKDCPSCDSSSGSYQGGCPGCIQAVPCINFQQNLSRAAGIKIAERMLERLKLTPLYKQQLHRKQELSRDGTDKILVSPKKDKRQKALTDASDLITARYRNIVVGRPGWNEQATRKGGTNMDGDGKNMGMSSFYNSEANGDDGGGFIS